MGLSVLKLLQIFETSLIMYLALILTYFHYCSSLRGILVKVYVSDWKSRKTRIARIVTLSNYEAHSSEFLHDLGRQKNQNIGGLHNVQFSCLTFTTNFFHRTSEIFWQCINLNNSVINLYIPTINDKIVGTN